MSEPDEKYIPRGFRQKKEKILKKCDHDKLEHWPFDLCADCIRQGPIVIPT